MKRIAWIGVIAVLALASDAIWAQQAAPPEQAAVDLPVRRVVLYKSGVGYFEHLGTVRDNQSITIDFTSDQLDDVLKSLTALDLGGGTVASVSYNTEASLERRLGGLRLPVGAGSSRAAFLGALRGARLEVRSGSTRVTGRLLSVERISRSVDGSTVSGDGLSIVTDAGDLHTFALDPGVSVRVVEQDLNDEVSRYLALVASERDQDIRRLTISASGTGERPLLVSYVSEVPVWKSTYRIVLPSAGETGDPLIQGWAIVDNTVGEDWTNVELSLVAGAPQSFVQSISQPYYVQRPVVPLPERALLSPQTHAGALTSFGTATVAGRVTDPSGSAIPGVTVTVLRDGTPAGQAVTSVNGQYSVPGLAPGQYQVRFELTGFRTVTRSGLRLTGGAMLDVSASLEVGALEETVTVTGASPMVDTRRTSTGEGFSRMAMDNIGAPLDPMIAAARANVQAAAAGAELGDLFEYTITEPVTIPTNQSALVPIVTGRVSAEKVSVWNAGAGTPRPLRALWVTNTTGLTLDGGSFTVVEDEAFAGEGLIEPLEPGGRRLLSYAIDLGTEVNASIDSQASRMTRVQVARGVVIQQSELRQRQTYTARNEDASARDLFIEHPVRPEWTLTETTTPEETTAEFHRFRMTVEPGTTRTFVVEETRPIETRYAVSALTDDQVALFVSGAVLSPGVEQALREVLAQKAAIAGLTTRIASIDREVTSIAGDQDRVRENMRALGSSAEERQLVQRYVSQLDAQETRLETLRTDRATLSAELTQAQAALAAFIQGISG